MNQQKQSLFKKNLYTSLLIFQFLIYGNLEFYQNIFQKRGNMAWTGIFLGLINNRNHIWILLFIQSLCWFLNFNQYILGIIGLVIIFAFVRFIKNSINMLKLLNFF
jgi:hypothetical protein